MSSIPKPVADLVFACFHSIEALDVFVELRTLAPAPCTAAALAARTDMPEAVVVAALQELVLAGLVVQIGTDSPLRYVLHPTPRYASDALEALAGTLRSERLELVALIGQHAIQRIRERALLAFLRKDAEQG